MSAITRLLPRLRCLLTTGLATLALLTLAPQAHAFNNILNTWQGIYGLGGTSGDNSQSGNNASCELCHANNNTGLWNGYGSQLEVLINSGTGAAAAMAQIEGNSSVNINGGTTFLDEIQASAQPGWTTGNNNTIFNNGAVVAASNVPPPAGIGDLDPAAAVPNIAVAPTTLAFGIVDVGNSSTLTTTITNNGTADLNVTALNLSGTTEFSLVNPPGTPFTLAPNASQDVVVDYTPSMTVRIQAH